ncbi:hypothetical protein SPRG_07431 [Saprolegnia parasitica CBS 223.65]|uniref:U1-type domain-containing protein n=1 Tax=Saprolegnia parasitica (strain CBS 223.65) TaxID=695850 RepID=A0A067CKA5_SAPPC|nr:hypothetical protein SPRG_07431 [Saprolegnia parasitica CBS 223.65]KDO27182.1 hypothetical protein SPRG_07431 [Saprolegnia parasitica CBS 223.65]|eukprot:XP_012201960.1 hypothetical protein SPRG_07431 [Saprolegnia parasitica CBS 223.65]
MADAPKKGVANVTRRTWDKAFFAQKAALRANGLLEEEVKSTKQISEREEFQAAPDGAAGPIGSSRAFLKARTKQVELEENVGKTVVLKADETMKGTGYYCEVCEVTLKDSVSYIDHINGKRHLRRLGFSMRVEKVGVEAVKERLNLASKRKWDPTVTKKPDAVEAYEKKLAEMDAEANLKKKQKKEAKKQQKEEAPVNVFATEDEEAMMAMMGFGGFQSTKKK